MYRLESKVRGEPPDETVTWRQRNTRKFLETFSHWIDSWHIPAPAHLRYIQLRENSLLLFFSDGRMAPDKNETERVIRGLCVGRKNYNGSRSVRGTKVSALFYSLLDSAHLAGVNPHEYLQTGIYATLVGEYIPLPFEIVVGDP